MDQTDVFSQLPKRYRAWNMWRMHGLKRRNGGTWLGSGLFRAVTAVSRLAPATENNLAVVQLPAFRVCLDLLDFETFNHSIPVFLSGSDELRFLRNVLRPGDVFVDVGANVGTFSLSACELVGENGSVIAIEPQARLALALSISKSANSYRQLSIHAVALADSEGQCDFFIDGDGSGTGSLIAHGSGAACIRTDVTTLDAVLTKFDIDRGIRLLKIDVEGAEAAVLRGARETVLREKPLVLFEANPHLVSGNIDGIVAVFQLLRDLGYRYFQCASSGLPVEPPIHVLVNVIASSEPLEG